MQRSLLVSSQPTHLLSIKRARLWHFPACYLFNFPSASFTIAFQRNMCCIAGRRKGRLDLCHLGLQSQTLGSRLREGRKTNKWSRKWNEDQQSVKNKAVFPFIAEPSNQARGSAVSTSSKGSMQGQAAGEWGEPISFQSSHMPSGTWSSRESPVPYLFLKHLWGSC